MRQKIRTKSLRQEIIEAVVADTINEAAAEEVEAVMIIVAAAVNVSVQEEMIEMAKVVEVKDDPITEMIVVVIEILIINGMIEVEEIPDIIAIETMIEIVQTTEIETEVKAESVSRKLLPQELHLTTLTDFSH